MASTFASVYYHVIFSTKDRYPYIADDVAPRLHGYIGGILRGEKGIPIAIGGTADHVHVLFAMRTEPSLATIVNKIKSNSSKWVHETFADKGKFAWQSGYGVFSVSASNVDDVKAYIASQAEHHRRRTFQEEFVAFLKKHGVEYDESHVWT